MRGAQAAAIGIGARDLADVQGERDDRRIAIDEVGICGLRHPIGVQDRQRVRQNTVASVRLAVSLSAADKGTHMSRFLELLREHCEDCSLHSLPSLLRAIESRLGAAHAQVEFAFPYFIERAAPVTGAKALVDFNCCLRGSSTAAGDELLLGVRVPVTSLCPSSKAISEYGAHNQRGEISIEVQPLLDAAGQPALLWIEELVAIADASASAPVYALLKRDDERHVTMQAYEHPVFVEDMVRGAAARLMRDARVAWFRVQALNRESIHNHDAYARIEWRREAETAAP